MCCSVCVVVFTASSEIFSFPRPDAPIVQPPAIISSALVSLTPRTPFMHKCRITKPTFYGLKARETAGYRPSAKYIPLLFRDIPHEHVLVGEEYTREPRHCHTKTKNCPVNWNANNYRGRSNESRLVYREKKVCIEKPGHTILQPTGKVFNSGHYLLTPSSAFTNDQPATKLPDGLLSKLLK